MKQGKKRSKKSNVPKKLQLCINVAAVICSEYPDIGRHVSFDRTEILAFAEAVARMAQIARGEKHLGRLLYALDWERAEEGVPLKQWGTDLLKRVLERAKGR